MNNKFNLGDTFSFGTITRIVVDREHGIRYCINDGKHFKLLHEDAVAQRIKEEEANKSEIFIAGRQFGKTAMLIKKSAETGARIAVANYIMASHVKNMAKNMGLAIPAPVLYGDVFENYLYNQNERYLVDELQMMLSQLKVDVATVDSEPIQFLAPWQLGKGEYPG